MGKSTFLQDFKAFAMKGNVIDMAVGVVIGGAFGKIVSSLVANVIMPPIGLLVGGVKVPYKIEARRPGDIAECWADPAKAKELLGWTAQKNLEDMCRDAWRWQTQNPNGYAD